MLVFSKVRELFVDSLRLKLDIEEIKRRLANQDKNLELVFYAHKTNNLQHITHQIKVSFSKALQNGTREAGG